MINTPQPTFYIFGAGSVGCYLGGLLKAGGLASTFIGRAPLQSTIQANGLKLTHCIHPPLTLAPSDIEYICTPPDDLKHASGILVTVKSQATADIGAELAHKVSPQTLIVSLQNGIRNVDILQKALPNNPVIGAIVPFNITQPAPAHFHCGVSGELQFSAHSHPALNMLTKAFITAHQPCVQVDDMKALQWSKLLINLNNGLNCLAGKPLTYCLAQRAYRLAFATSIDEALRLLKQANITVGSYGKVPLPTFIRLLRLPDFLYHPVMRKRITVDENARTSMLDDLEAGRACEIDYLQGEIIRLATTLEKTAPYNQAVYDLVTQAFAQGYSPSMSGKEILRYLRQAKF